MHNSKCESHLIWFKMWNSIKADDRIHLTIQFIFCCTETHNLILMRKPLATNILFFLIDEMFNLSRLWALMFVEDLVWNSLRSTSKQFALTWKYDLFAFIIITKMNLIFFCSLCLAPTGLFTHWFEEYLNISFVQRNKTEMTWRTCENKQSKKGLQQLGRKGI